MTVPKQASQQSVPRALAVSCGRSASTSGCAERLVPGVLVRILFSIVQLLFEGLGLFLVGK
jgi:hypothetical protein